MFQLRRRHLNRHREPILSRQIQVADAIRKLKFGARWITILCTRISLRLLSLKLVSYNPAAPPLLRRIFRLNPPKKLITTASNHLHARNFFYRENGPPRRRLLLLAQRAPNPLPHPPRRKTTQAPQRRRRRRALHRGRGQGPEAEAGIWEGQSLQHRVYTCGEAEGRYVTPS
jgi:hypothetical protein